jgi:uncharacterized protein
MKIVVVSDTHGDTLYLNRVYDTNKDADLFLHAGDYQLPDYMMHIFRFVKGNCDYSYEAPCKVDINTPIGKLHMEHGNNYFFINDTLNYIKKENSSIFIVGHTHIPYFTKIDNTYVFNPGSLCKPRSTNFGTFLIIKIDENDDNKLSYQFKKIDLQTLEISNYSL